MYAYEAGSGRGGFKLPARLLFFAGTALIPLAIALVLLLPSAASASPSILPLTGATASTAGTAQNWYSVVQSRSPAPQTHRKAMWGPPEVDGVSQFPMYRDLGVGIYQLAVAWSDIAPTRPSDPLNPGDPAYVWPDSLGEAISEARSYDMKVMLMVIGAPAWANGGRSDRSWAPSKPADFAHFMTAAARKYSGVRYWMVWGEPNRSANFKPLSPSRTGPLNRAQARAPRLYGRILNAAYGALKAVSPWNKVIGGNTYTAAGLDSISTYQWIRYMRLANGDMPRMDFYGHNPFTFRKPALRSKQSPKGRVDFSDLSRLARQLDRFYPRKRLKLFLSEWGVPGGGKDSELGFQLNQKKQAQWIRAAFRVRRNLKRIYTLGWIHPFDRPDIGITTGLLDSSGKPKLGYNAFRAG